MQGPCPRRTLHNEDLYQLWILQPQDQRREGVNMPMLRKESGQGCFWCSEHIVEEHKSCVAPRAAHLPR